MSVPLTNVIQLATKAAPSAYGEALMKHGESMEADPASLVPALRCRSQSNIDMAPPSRAQKNPTGLVILKSDLPMPIDLTKYSRGDDDEAIVQRISEY